MDFPAHVAALEREGHLLAQAADRPGWDAAVPSCPEWTVRDLVAHIGQVHRVDAELAADGDRAVLDRWRDHARIRWS